jgi:hypothetical protein
MNPLHPFFVYVVVVRQHAPMLQRVAYAAKLRVVLRFSEFEWIDSL